MKESESVVKLKTGTSRAHLLSNRHVLEYALIPESLLSTSKQVDKDNKDIMSYAVAKVGFEAFNGIDGFVYSLYTFPTIFSHIFAKVIHNSIIYIASNRNVYSALNGEQESLISEYGNKVDKMVLDKMVLLDQFISLYSITYSISGIPRKVSNEFVLSNGITIPKDSETIYLMYSSVKPIKPRVISIGENTWIKKLDDKSHINNSNDLCWGLST
ncbi:hypothetical protein BB560_001266 [Smittium megazygosporum]|uniref:Uncharacterized protein n=1 Tax=Smittium megazygosporum TaxID=133381 RepID=A0A2T9ZIA5_9FUNG|nr:hypothetical protein BB560_001266 [Smittium megazygosporum]